MDDLLPWLYLRGLSRGDFREALPTLLGPGPPGLSARAATRLVQTWQVDHNHWS